MAIRQFMETVIRINAETGNGFSKVGSTLAELGSIVDGLSTEIIDFGKESVAVYRDYEKSMRDAEVALSTNYGRGTVQLQRVMDRLDSKATEWAATTIFHTDDVANAISEAAHAGWDYQQIMAGIPAAMRLAQAGNLDLSQAVDYVVKSTNAANIGFENMDHWIDLWTYAANSSASDIGEFGDAMLRMGSTMRFAANPAELMTLIAVTADAGAVGSEAGTMIRNSLMRLIAPTDKAKDAMAELGATSEEMSEIMNDEALAAANAELASRGFTVFDQSTGELRPILDIYSDLGDVLADIAGGYDKISKNSEATELLGAIFPTRTITEALNLLNAAADGYGGLYDQLMAGEAEGYGQYAAETMMDTLNGDIEIFESKAERLKQVLGEQLKGQVESVAGALGGIADWAAELDPDKFAALTGAVETVALAGPGLLTAGTALRLIGLVFGTTGGAIAAGALAAAAGLGALIAWDAEKFDENFGTMNLDLAELDRNLDNLTTDGEDRLAVVDGYVQRLGELADEYRNAADGFNQQITMATLTGKTLTPAERDQIVALGESMTDALIEGITTRRESDLTLLNSITPEDMTGEEYETYSGLFDMLSNYYGDLEGEASEIGAKLQQAILDALNDDGRIDQAEREGIQKLGDMLNNMEAGVAAERAQEEYYAELEKASRVSKDNIEEYMASLEAKQAERTEDVYSQYDGFIARAQNAYAKEFEKQYGRLPTQEEWRATDYYKDLVSRREGALQPISEQIGTFANTAMMALLGDSDMGDTFRAAMDIFEQQGGADSEHPFTTETLGRYISEGGYIPATAFDDVTTMLKSGGILSFLDIGESEFAKMLEPFAGTEFGADLYNMFGGNELLSQFQYAAGILQDDIFKTMAANYGITAQGAATILYGAPAEATAEGEQTVTVDVNGDTTELTAAIGELDGEDVTAMVGGDVTGLQMAILDEEGRLLTELVTGDATQLANLINSFQGRTIRLNFTQASVSGKALYATGGRATTASIFGEAGPEWAIPEEHTDHTAALLDAARAASGFTWPDLLGRLDATGSGGTQTGDQTFIYAPVINAQNAAGVEAVLRQDKDRFKKWWEEKRLHDAVEVYQ